MTEGMFVDDDGSAEDWPASSHFRHILSLVPIEVAVIGQDGGIRLASSTQAATLAAHAEIAAALSAAIDGTALRAEGELPQPSADTAGRNWRHWQVRAVPPPGQGALLAAMDISRQKEAERQSRASLHFATMLSHELRTSLNAIIGFSDMMALEKWGPLGDQHYRGYAENIREAGNHLLLLINSILALSRANTASHPLREEPVDLGQLMHQSGNILREQASRNGLVLALEVERPVPTPRVDPPQTRQWLLHCMSNANTFTPAGGQVVAQTGIDDQGWPYLRVRDTGIGIAAEHLDLVMEPFGQIDSEQSRHHAEQGTGLGLPLARRFVELHGGQLHLSSQPGAGTTVTARFPPHRLDAECAGWPPPAP